MGGIGVPQLKEVEVKFDDEALKKLGTQTLQHIFGKVDHIMRFESNQGNRNISDMESRTKSLNKDNQTSLKESWDLMNYAIEKGEYLLSDIMKIKSKFETGKIKDKEAVNQIRNDVFIKTTGLKAKNSIEESFPKSNELIGIVDNPDLNDKDKLNKVFTLTNEFYGSRFNQIKKIIKQNIEKPDPDHFFQDK